MFSGQSKSVMRAVRHPYWEDDQKIVIAYFGDFSEEFLVKVHYDPRFVSEISQIPSRGWLRGLTSYSFSRLDSKEVWDALCKSFPGARGFGPKGYFRVPNKNLPAWPITFKQMCDPYFK